MFLNSTRTRLLPVVGAITCTLATSGYVQGISATPAHKTYNVKTYGATGNGTTDDTSAILAAISAAGSNTGNEVLFPSGTYLISSGLTATGLLLHGQAGAVLTTNSQINMLTVSGTSPTVSNISFVAGSSATSATAINVTSASNVTVSNNSVGSVFYADVQVSGTTGGSITGNSLVMNTGPFGIFLQNCNGVSVLRNNITQGTVSQQSFGIAELNSQNDTIQANTVNGLSNFLLTNGIISQTSTSTVITRNVLQNGGQGIVLTADTSPTASSNTVSNYYNAGFNAGNNLNATIESNKITNTGLVAMLVGSNRGSCGVTSNTINGAGSFGIKATGGGNIAVGQNQITDCGLSASTTAVIYVDEPNATATSITSNVYKGNTSNLTYFIDSVQAAPIATVSGNRTNTLLPTKVGTGSSN